MVLSGRWALENMERVSSSVVHWFPFVVHSKPSLSCPPLDQLGPLVAEPSPEARSCRQLTL